MTDEERNQAWVTLPDDFKENVKKMFRNYNVLKRYDNCYIESCNLLYELFGKNLGPKYAVGDVVNIITDKYNGKGLVLEYSPNDNTYKVESMFVSKKVFRINLNTKERSNQRFLLFMNFN